MFLAVGLDLSSEPCPLVVMSKKGEALDHRVEERPIDCIVSYLEDIVRSSGKIVFCAISEEDAFEFEPHYCRRLREKGVYIKMYDHAFLVRMENMLMDLADCFPRRAYCLAKIVQTEELDLATYREDIRKLYDLREILDRVLINLATLHALPDDCYLPDRW